MPNTCNICRATTWSNSEICSNCYDERRQARRNWERFIASDLFANMKATIDHMAAKHDACKAGILTEDDFFSAMADDVDELHNMVYNTDVD